MKVKYFKKKSIIPINLINSLDRSKNKKIVGKCIAFTLKL